MGPARSWRRRRSYSRRGQLRVLEATIAAIAIFFSFMTASYFTRNPRSWTVSRSEDLTRLGYNILHSLAVKDVLNKTIATGNVGWELQVNFILQALLPSTTFYNLTVYRVLSLSGNWNVEYKIYNNVMISNSESGSPFTKTPEVVSVSYLYTSRLGGVYLLVLQLSDVRGESGSA